MKKFLIGFSFGLVTSTLLGQQVHHANKDDAAFYNRVMKAFNQALPKEFKGWTVSLPDKDVEPMKEGANLFLCEEPSCWRTQESGGTYDGTTFQDEGYTSYQKAMKALKMDDPDIVKKMSSLLYEFTNSRMVTVKIGVNVSTTESLHYCKASGYQKLAPPAGWSAFYTSSIQSCLPTDGSDPGVDLNILSIGLLPQLKEEKSELYFETPLTFQLNKALIKSYKVQNIVIRIQGAKELAQEFLKSVNMAPLQRLLNE